MLGKGLAGDEMDERVHLVVDGIDALLCDPSFGYRRWAAWCSARHEKTVIAFDLACKDTNGGRIGAGCCIAASSTGNAQQLLISRAQAV